MQLFLVRHDIARQDTNSPAPHHVHVASQHMSERAHALCTIDNLHISIIYSISRMIKVIEVVSSEGTVPPDTHVELLAAGQVQTYSTRK